MNDSDERYYLLLEKDIEKTIKDELKKVISNFRSRLSSKFQYLSLDEVISLCDRTELYIDEEYANKILGL